MFGKCGCGREGKYVSFIDGNEVMSCSKRARCPSYDEMKQALEDEILTLKSHFVKLRSEAGKRINGPELTTAQSGFSFIRQVYDQCERILNGDR